MSAKQKGVYHTASEHLKPMLTVDVVIFTIEADQLKVLLIERSREPFKGSHALPGGFIESNEKLEAAAQRILVERAGVGHMYLEQLYTFDGSGKDPRGRIPTVAYVALARRDSIAFASNQAQLVSVIALPPMAFDHAGIVKYAMKRLRYKLEYTNAVASLLPAEFTLQELQRVYEIIFARPIDKRNFRKKFLSLDMITETKKMRSGGRHRPARLYRFKTMAPTSLANFF